MTLARHGFSHMLARMQLTESIPLLARFSSRAQPEEGEHRLNNAERLAQAFQELGATFIKFGQLLATRPDLIPADFVRAFTRLQDQVQPLPGEVIRKRIEDELNQTVDNLFNNFEDEAIASGSIGQVHYATLKDGTRVVVKIKRPDTDRKVRDDLDLLGGLAKLAEDYLPELRIMRPKMVVEEFARVMERELDFVGEASYTAKFGREFEEDETVKAPVVYWDFVTHNVMVIERIEGKRLTQIDDYFEKDEPRRQVLAETLGRCFMRQFFVTGFFHADPHPGNIFVIDEDQIALIDFGQMGYLSDELRRQLALTMIALSQGDVDFIVDVYSEIGVFTEHTNLREFRSELYGIIDRYYGIPLDRLDMAEAMQEVLSVARSNSLLLPRDFVLLAKSFVTIMGVVRKLDPGFRADKVVKPFTREIFFDLASPSSILKRVGFYAYRVMAMIRRAPDDIRDLLEKTKGGNLRIVFHHDGLEDVVSQAERAINRLTLGIIIAAVTIGSSIVLTAGQNILPNHSLPLFGNFPLSVIVSGIGFGVASFMGLWVAWGILRGKRL